MKFTQHSQPPERRRGIVMLPVEEGWSATWFDYATSDLLPAKVPPPYTEWIGRQLHNALIAQDGPM